MLAVIGGPHLGWHYNLKRWTDVPKVSNQRNLVACQARAYGIVTYASIKIKLIEQPPRDNKTFRKERAS